MTTKRSNNRTHKRVAVYKVTQNTQYNHFLMNPTYIYEKQVKFVYDTPSGKTIEKVIPVEDIIQHSKYRIIGHWDEGDPTLWVNKGYVYQIEKDFVYNY